ncbi:MAG: glycoside hydrolase family 3 C-terminal domain-containing protein [Blautia sp.]|nr:glycoside hydrolase family 3 C-terminal domain-containing protein [Blautia sp.]
MVLLKNNGVLPLTDKGKKLALFGNGARHTVRGGTGSGDVNVRSTVTIEDGLKKAGFIITTEDWLDRYDAYCAKMQEAYAAPIREEMQKGNRSAMMKLFTAPYQEPSSIPVEQRDVEESDTDTAIYVISRISGEGKDRTPDRGDFALFEQDEETLKLLISCFENVIVVLNVGGVIDTEFLRETKGIGAVVLMSQAGIAGGDALASVLSGKVVPSGHLTATWAKHYEDYPSADSFSHMNGNMDDEYYREGIYVGYRYFDTFHITPAYPFGFGLSYTKFELNGISVRLDAWEIIVSANVKNIGGTYAGKEVVQVYVSAPDGKLEKPYQELKGFAKTGNLFPGESETVEIRICAADLASYDVETSAWILEEGYYYIRVGNHSRNTHIAAALVVSENLKTEQAKAMFALDETFEELKKTGKEYSYPGEDLEKEQAPKLFLQSDLLSCHPVTYSSQPAEEPEKSGHVIQAQEVLDGSCTLDELVSQLSLEEMAELCVGTMRRVDNSLAFIGQASNTTPGAAGETSSLLLKSRGIRNLVMADGPAGLRISRFYAVDNAGKQVQGVGDYTVPGLAMILGEPKEEAPDGAILHYQYCTAIPIGTLLAQTWDPALIEEAGDIVGEELEEFGVTLWLAPGMNIQRNPLCGRNFEYYSEDPLLSGVCAASDTRGVQRHPGVGTTIKHFAFNNQEDNRMHVNAHIGERAAREIYLKGFEIAVKTSWPKAVMSSYNLVNGIHAANSHDLLTKDLRDEWGYHGMVMTDWGTTGGIEMEPGKTFKYGTSTPEGCIAAGNDLIMPGSQEDVDGIVAAVQEGKLEKGTLQLSVKRILDLVLHSASYQVER